MLTWLFSHSCKTSEENPPVEPKTALMWKRGCTQTCPPTFHFYSVSVIGLCEGSVFVVLQDKVAPSSRTNSTGLVQRLTERAWGCIGGGEGGV